MRILNIAEKPSVAKSISKLMSRSINTTRGFNKYCSNMKFSYNGDEMIFTSVLGHLFHLKFVKKYNWEQIEPESLFYEEVEKEVTEEGVRKNIEKQVQYADRVVIWTDCDREGENISKQIESVVLSVKEIDVYRARFSGISLVEIQRALENLTTINNHEAEAVDSRMELDLKIGSPFTIFQTLKLKNLFDKKQIVSFGPCQIPTLGFVVDRYEEIESHIKENFWTLKLHCKKPKDRKTEEDVFDWRRGRIFDNNCVIHFINYLSPLDKIISKIETKSTVKCKPLPLRTVELQKLCSSIFKISSHKIMTIAEKLYNQGYISYSRTETDSYNQNFNFRNILESLKLDNAYTNSIEQIQNNFKYPRKGKNNDMAHSPIYPIKAGQSLTGLERSIYDFISRRFLGGLCEDATGMETLIEVKVGKEIFFIKGHTITNRNYLNVYTYDNWTEKKINSYVLGEKINGELIIEEGKTEPPGFLTESELISLMDKNGIGTDATIHEHIQKIQEREYAKKVGLSIIPEKLGIALIRAYKNSNLEFNKPFLRKNLELKLKEVCDNKMNKTQLVNEEIRIYHDLFNILKANQQQFVDYIFYYIQTNNALLERPGRNTRPPSTRAPSSTTRPPTSTNSTIQSTTQKKNDKATTETNSFYCDCGKKAIESETKEGGKSFFTCSGEDVRCTFFKWASVMDKCYCGYDPILLTSKTENNMGRKFYKCKKVYKPCKYFKWEA